MSRSRCSTSQQCDAIDTTTGRSVACIGLTMKLRKVETSTSARPKWIDSLLRYQSQNITPYGVTLGSAVILQHARLKAWGPNVTHSVHLNISTKHLCFNSGSTLASE